MDAGPPNVRADSVVIERLRLWVLGVLVLGLIGTVTELILLEHYEQALQFVPLVLIALGVVVLAWHYASQGTASLRALQIVMVLFVLSGFAGMLAHFNGSMEYQLELNPDMSMWELLEKILRAKAPPLLAPGMMIQMGLLGLAYAYTDIRYRGSK
jgi:glucose-6-phosphate-specific signal transduction histidine kinase